MVCFLNRFKLCKVSFDEVEINILWNSLTWNVVNIFTRSLKLRREHLTVICCCHPKGNKRWRNSQFFKSTRHRVLTADGWQTELNLCFNRTKQSCYWLTKTSGLFVHTLEIFLIREASLRPVSTCCNQASCCFNNRISSTVVRWPFCNIRVEPLRHDWSGICYTMLNWQFLYRSLSRCDLVTATKWMIDSWATNWRVKDCLQSFLASVVKIWKNSHCICFKSCSWCCAFFRNVYITVNHISINHHAHTIGIKESTFQIYNNFTIPVHNQIWFFSHCRNDNSVNIFFVTFRNEGIHIFWTNQNRHPFLWFRDSNFCSIQTLVF